MFLCLFAEAYKGSLKVHRPADGIGFPPPFLLPGTRSQVWINGQAMETLVVQVPKMQKCKSIIIVGRQQSQEKSLCHTQEHERVKILHMVTTGIVTT